MSKICYALTKNAAIHGEVRTNLIKCICFWSIKSLTIKKFFDCVLYFITNCIIMRVL